MLFNTADSFQGENKMKCFIVVVLTTIFVCAQSGECEHIYKYYIKTMLRLKYQLEFKKKTYFYAIKFLFAIYLSKFTNLYESGTEVEEQVEEVNG